MGTETILSEHRAHYFDGSFDHHHHDHFVPANATEVTALFTGKVGTSILGQTDTISKLNLFIKINEVDIPVYVQKGTNFLNLYYDTIDDESLIITRHYVPVQEYNNKVVKMDEVVNIPLNANAELIKVISTQDITDVLNDQDETVEESIDEILNDIEQLD